jgi:hypothetical protein
MMQTTPFKLNDGLPTAKKERNFMGWSPEHNPSLQHLNSDSGGSKKKNSSVYRLGADSRLKGHPFHVLLMISLRYLPLILLLLGFTVWGQDAVIPSSTTRPLAEALDANGRLLADVDGGFDARDYTISIASDGTPRFHRATFAQGEESNKWNNGFGTGPGVGDPNFTVNALAVSGDDIYIGGDFRNAGGVAKADAVARFNRAENRWYALGDGITGNVYAIATDGEDVYVGGLFVATDADGKEYRYIGRYNKNTNTWHTLGSGVMRPNDPDKIERGVSVVKLIDGEVWIGGYYVNAGGIADADVLALWDTKTQKWESVGQIYTIDPNGETNIYEVEPFGNGVYVHGYCAFSNSIRRHAVFDNGAWKALPVISANETAQFARGIVDGSDIILVRGRDGLHGLPGVPDSTHAVRYNGSNFTPIPGKIPYRSIPGRLAIVKGELVVGLQTQGGAEHPYVIKHNGSAWVEVGPRLNSIGVNALAVIDGDLWVGGRIERIEGDPLPINGFARFDGTNWKSVGPSGNGLMGGSITRVSAVAIWKGKLYIGGDFEDASGDPEADYVARWTGSAWEGVGGGLNRSVLSLLPAGDRLYAGGNFFDVAGVSGANRLAQFDGTSWTPLGKGFGNGTPHALAVIGNDLYVGGSFYEAAKVRNATNIARWDGSKWHALVESGSGDNPSGKVYALLVAPDGTLIVGGDFNGLYEHDNLARWNPTARDWTAIGPEPNAAVRALAFDADGKLVVGGDFTGLGGGDALARWDGTAWQAYGSGLTGIPNYAGVIQPPKVHALHVVGKNLFVGGSFANAGGLAGTENVAYWDGAAWQSLSIGVDKTVEALGSDGSLLWVGGLFQTTADDVKVISRVGSHPLPNVVSLEPQPKSNKLALKVWPNPMTSGARVQLTLASPAKAEVTMFDAYGRLVATLHHGQTGTVELAIPEGLRPGLYILRAQSNASVTTVSVMVLR